nr:hypothetical protein [uncultured Methanospirillum sp.]
MGIYVIFLLTGFTVADRLPNQTPENQIFSIDSVIDATGLVDEKTTQSWVLASPGAIPTGILGSRQTVSDVFYQDSILTNGGKLSENKNFDFNSRDQKGGLYNLESQKVLTYASTEGSHMVGEEEYTISIAGNYTTTDGNIRCVFAGQGTYMPVFCNIVSAKASLVNVNSAQVSSKGQIRTVAETMDVPSALNYQIAVSPDKNSGSNAAEGTVKTVFAGSIMEARDAGGANYARNGSDGNPATWNKTGATNTWKDSSAATGLIRTFQKGLLYSSSTTPTEGSESITTPTATPTPVQTGTIDLVDTSVGSYYRLIGPGISYEGHGSNTYHDIPVGSYQIVTCDSSYSPYDVGTLTEGDTITYYFGC